MGKIRLLVKELCFSYFSLWCLLWEPVDNETKAEGEMETTLGMEEALEELSEMCKHQNEQNESAELGNRLGYCARPCACA